MRRRDSSGRSHAGRHATLLRARPRRLREIQRLTTELGLNLAGVRRVLALEDELAALRQMLDRLEREMNDAVDSVHKQYRRDVVLYSEAQRELRLPRRRGQ